MNIPGWVSHCIAFIHPPCASLRLSLMNAMVTRVGVGGKQDQEWSFIADIKPSRSTTSALWLSGFPRIPYQIKLGRLGQISLGLVCEHLAHTPLTKLQCSQNS